MRLSDDAAARLTLAEDEAERIDWDEILPGFGHRQRRNDVDRLRISRRWVCQFKVGRRTRRVTLGDPAVVRCAAARRKARELLAKVQLGEDPQAARIAARRAVTFGTRAEQYLAEVVCALRPATQDAYRRHLLVHAKALHSRPAEVVSRSEIAALLSAIGRARGLVAANRTRATLSACFAWCVMEHELPSNPVVGTRVHPERSRDRVLNNTELAAIWQATRSGSDFDRIIRLLMLTACRRDEIGRICWSEIAGDVFTLPAHRSKNRVKNDIPLHPLAMAQLPPRTSGRDAVFGRGESGFSGWSRCKARLAAQLSLPAWTPHDLRRACATWLSENSTEPAHVDAVLGHISGVAKAGVAGVYNRASYEMPKRQALMRWGDHIAAITGQDATNLTALGRSL